MRTLEYIDDRGRKYKVELPDDVPDSEAEAGIVLGPPMDLVDTLQLPEPIATRVHNELYRRELWTYKDAQRRPQELEAALKAALRIDIQLLLGAYMSLDRL